MKVTLINTSDTGGGAPVACRRLMKALNTNACETGMLVQQKRTGLPEVSPVLHGKKGELIAQYHFLAERLPFIAFHERDRSLRFAFSEANSGTDISKHPLVQEADILHLHWTNRGFLSIRDIRKLLDLGKPMVWTLHDMWAFTGGCHYTGGCDHFLNECGNCPMLRQPSEKDLSRRGWIRKSKAFENTPLHIVTCSNWLADSARSSSLLRNFPIHTIPNPIDTEKYKPGNSAPARQKWNIDPRARLLLFGAANINDKRKGLTYLLEAVGIYQQNYSQDPERPLELVMFGKNTSFDASGLNIRVHLLPLIDSEDTLIELYGMADGFVHPSLEDNLPNMVMEAMACGTPCVAFDTGGLPDLITHQSDGYLAEYRSAEDFARGIDWLLHAPQQHLRESCRTKVVEQFNNEKVAMQYATLYQSILNANV